MSARISSTIIFVRAYGLCGAIGVASSTRKSSVEAYTDAEELKMNRSQWLRMRWSSSSTVLLTLLR